MTTLRVVYKIEDFAGRW